MAKTSDKEVLFIVEDDEAWSASLAAKLGKKYEVHTFVSGEAAVEALDKNEPRILVLDYHLEGDMTGFDVLKASKKKLPQSYAIMFTAQDDIQIALDILNSGAYDYIVKGENALNRLKILLRNIDEREALRSQMVELKFRVRRERLMFFIVVAVIVIGSLVIFLNTCPDTRPFFSWDPFGVAESDHCQLGGAGVRDADPTMPDALQD